MNPYFSIKDAVRFAWDKTKERISFFAFIAFAIMSISMLFSEASANSTSALPAIVFEIAQLIFGVLTGMGFVYLTLHVVRNESATLRDFAVPAPLFWKYLGASMLYILIIIGGLILLVVPGIIWMIKFSQFKFIIVDKKDISIRQAMRESAIMTKGLFWKLFSFMIVLTLINILGFLFFFVGLLVTIPLTSISFAYVYKRLLVRLQPVVLQ